MTTNVLSGVSADELPNMLEQLRFGETITLLGADGLPAAVVVSVRLASTGHVSFGERQTRWDMMAQKVGQVWRSPKGAVETPSEMRR